MTENTYPNTNSAVTIKKKKKNGHCHDIAPFNYLIIETVCILLACLRGAQTALIVLIVSN